MDGAVGKYRNDAGLNEINDTHKMIFATSIVSLWNKKDTIILNNVRPDFLKEIMYRFLCMHLMQKGEMKTYHVSPKLFVALACKQTLTFERDLASPEFEAITDLRRKRMSYIYNAIEYVVMQKAWFTEQRM